MSNGFNPYAVAQSLSQLQQSGLEAEQKGKIAKQEVDIQKGKMSKQYFADIREAEREAQEALAKKRKKSKGGLFSTLIGAINPIAGAVLGGLGSALEGKKQGEHLLGQAELAKKHAMDIDPRWKGTFLGKGAEEYLGAAESGYGDLVRQARDVASQTGSMSGMLKTGLASGLTSFATGKAMQGFGEKLGSMKDVKGAQPKFDELVGAGFDPEMVAGGIKGQVPSLGGFGEDELLKLLQSDAPGLKNLFQGIGGIGKTFATQDPFGEGDKGEMLSGLLAMLSQYE